MKGIILAAGKGTRLYPMTLPTCKPLLPVYDKPLIYYSLSVLMQAGISDVMIIIPPDEEPSFTALLGDGSQLGIHISYAVQKVARGIADAMLIGKDFVGSDSVCLVLGDNIFYHPELTKTLMEARKHPTGATVFGYYVDDPRPFGVVEFDESGKAISIEEKPRYPKSNYIIPGLYFYDNQVIDIAEHLTPSARGELEITDVNLAYLNRDDLHVIPLDRGFAWMDAGTADSLLDAAFQIKQIQDQTGRYVGCIEELAYHAGWISQEQVHALGTKLEKTLYGQYLLCL
ncbi:MAG: glucose-1-phosphate thymidylyltransferase RfbA [Oscillospiraceae bacterium]|nr:glucose-1-phosphate thymidylyltransferase RfbA [Oscillospiraceae bacterium]